MSAHCPVLSRPEHWASLTSLSTHVALQGGVVIHRDPLDSLTPGTEAGQWPNHLGEINTWMSD